MATRKGQRIAIWVIAGAMLVGTIGGFAVMMIDPNGTAGQQEDDFEAQFAEWQREQEELARARAEASQPLEGYEATTFDASAVSELGVEVLREGNGEELDASSTISANYFGWTSNGSIFDSTNQSGTTEPAEFPLSGVINGWTEGLTGVKVGSVVRLSIPSDQAYGEQGSPPNIGPNEPLMFIVEVVEKVEEA